MNVRVKATNYEITAEVQAYLDQRLEALAKLLSGYEDLARMEVELGRDAGGQRHGDNMWFAEVQVIVPGRDRVFARNNSESVNGAIDDVKEEVERQMRRQNRMHRRFAREGGAMLKRIMRFGRE